MLVMAITFDIPRDIQDQLGTAGADLNRRAREAFLLELYRAEQISHAQLREALDMSFHQVETLIKQRAAGLEASIDEFEADRAFLLVASREAGLEPRRGGSQ